VVKSNPASLDPLENIIASVNRLTAVTLSPPRRAARLGALTLLLSLYVFALNYLRSAWTVFRLAQRFGITIAKRFG
jgi:hypothetical protein